MVGVNGPFLGKEVLETGNCLIIAAEESKNEIKLKFKAIEQVYGDVFNQKIYYRGNFCFSNA